MKKLTLLLGLLCSSSTFAETITNGFIDVVGGLPIGTFHLVGNNFEVQGQFTDGVWPSGNIFAPGTAVSANGVVVGNDISGGSGTVMGVFFPSVNFGDLNALKPSGLYLGGPDITVNSAGLHIGSFTFTGQLCGTTPPANPLDDPPCSIDLPELTGQGRLVLTVVDDGVGDLRISRATYLFTPEPSTFLLSAAPILFILAKRFRRTKVLKQDINPQDYPA